MTEKKLNTFLKSLMILIICLNLFYIVKVLNLGTVQKH